MSKPAKEMNVNELLIEIRRVVNDMIRAKI